MAIPPKPCTHCGGVSLQILPNMQADVAVATTVMGMSAKHKVSGVFWTFTLVACTSCGCTLVFTANVAQLAQHVPGAQLTTVAER